MTTTKELIKELKKLQAKYGVCQIGIVDSEELEKMNVQPAGVYFLDALMSNGKSSYTQLLMMDLNQAKKVDAIAKLQSEDSKVIRETVAKVFSETGAPQNKEEMDAFAGKILDEVKKPDISIVPPLSELV